MVVGKVSSSVTGVAQVSQIRGTYQFVGRYGFGHKMDGNSEIGRKWLFVRSLRDESLAQRHLEMNGRLVIMMP